MAEAENGGDVLFEAVGQELQDLTFAVGEEFVTVLHLLVLLSDFGTLV
jgi:hypothetical protein